MDEKSKGAAKENPPGGGRVTEADKKLEVPAATVFGEGADVSAVPHSPPVWEDPEFIAPLVVLGDERERSVVQNVLKLRYEISDLLNTAIGEHNPDDACATLKDACVMAKAYMATVEELQTMRTKGIQKVTVFRVQGPRIGLTAKTQALGRSGLAPPLAALIDEVEFVKDHFSNAADRFLRKADEANRHVGDQWYSVPLGIALIERKDVSGLRKASATASTMSAKIGVLVDEIARDHRQVIVREEIALGCNATESVRRRRSDSPRACDAN